MELHQNKVNKSINGSVPPVGSARVVSGLSSSRMMDWRWISIRRIAAAQHTTSRIMMKKKTRINNSSENNTILLLLFYEKTTCVKNGPTQQCEIKERGKRE